MKNLLIGILVGAGAILPGISSGVFCVAFGLYEEIINSILHFFKDTKKNLYFLINIAVGIAIGIFLFGNIIKYIFDKFYMPCCFSFIGLILGSLHLVFKQANLKRLTFTHILCTLLSFSLSIYILALESNTNFILETNSNLYLVFAGMLMSIGIVIPGVSKTVILMLLGMYPLYLTAITTFNLNILIPIGIGLCLGSLIFLIILNILFKYVKSYTYFFIIGFVLGSTLIIYPGFSINLEGLFSIILFFISLYFSWNLGKKN